MSWKIQKAFEFCYGHRVWGQKLDPQLSRNAPCKCRHLHGHEARVELQLSGARLDDTAMVTDFNNLNFLKHFLDTYVDHKFIIDCNDPLYLAMVGVEVKDLSLIPMPTKDLFAAKVLPSGDPSPTAEYLNSFIVVDFCPTSENLSKWIFSYAQAVLEGTAVVESVTWHESPKSQATYYRS